MAGALPHLPRPHGAHAGETKRVCAICFEGYVEGDKVRTGEERARRYASGDQGGAGYVVSMVWEGTRGLWLCHPARAVSQGLSATSPLSCPFTYASGHTYRTYLTFSYPKPFRRFVCCLVHTASTWAVWING